jgi:hypothetical protein
MQRALTREMRLLYATVAVLAFGAAVVTFVLAGEAADYWSWAISPPISAAFLGGCFCAALALLAPLARAPTWAETQMAAAPLMAASLLLAATTAICWDSFEHSRVAFWLWVAACALLPPLLLLALDRQLRQSGQMFGSGDPLPILPTIGLAAHAAVLLVFGALMFAVPGFVEGFWPWQLSGLTSRALGSFVFGFGAGAFVVLRTNDLGLTRLPGLAYAVFGAAELIAVARYGGEIDFGAAAVIYVAFLASAVLLGLTLFHLGSASSASPRTRLASGHGAALGIGPQVEPDRLS